MKLMITVAAAAAALTIALLVVWSPADGEQPGAASPAGEFARSIAGAMQEAASGRVEHVESRVDPLPMDSSGFLTRAQELALMPPDAEREKALRSLAQDWAAEDPTAAERWAASLETSAEREHAMSHICLKVAEVNPDEAANIAQWHRIDKGVVEAIASRWAESDFEAAVVWAGTFSDPETRNRILSRLALARAGTAPEEAAVIVSESLAPGEAQQEAAIAVLHQWLLKDVHAAQRWVEMFPEGALKERAVAEIRGVMTYRGLRSE